MKNIFTIIALTISFSMNAQTFWFQGTGQNAIQTYNTTASGTASTAMGNGTTASGTASTAMGNGTTANGVGSTAMGGTTIASGTYSTAMGAATTASGTYSTAMGGATTASGLGSTAMGRNTTASDYGSLVIGQYNSSGSAVTSNATSFDTANTAFVIGNGVDSSNISDAFSILFDGTTTIAGSVTATSFVGDGSQLTGITGSASSLNDLTDVLVDSNNSMFLGTPPANSTGEYNTALGYKPLYSNTEGDNNTALGEFALYSNTTGDDNTASGSGALATNTTGNNNTALGYNAVASSAEAINQTIIGYEATGVADNSVVLGNDDVTAVYMGEDSGATVYAAGLNIGGTEITSTAAELNLLSGATSLGTGILSPVTENSNTGVRLSTAVAANHGDIGSNAVDLSYSTSASTTRGATGYASTAMGKTTEASGYASTAMGATTEASGNASTAMGAFTTASGDYSTAMGRSTEASGVSSTAMGESTTASDFGSTVIGQYNSSGSTVTNSADSFSTANTAFVIGNGVDSSNISDAFSILFDGTTTIAGSVTATSFVGDGSQLTGITGSTSSLNDLTDVLVDSNNSMFLGTPPANSTGEYNTALGYKPLYSNTEGDNNTALGEFALYSNTTGDDNTASGSGALATNTTGNNNTALGYNAVASSAEAINQTIIGYEATGVADNSVVLGNDDVTAVYMGEDSGATVYAAGLNIGGTEITSTAAELNLLSGATSLGTGILSPVTENSNTGVRLSTAVAANHGDIGSNAVDLSYSTSPSTTRGATGVNSTAMGLNTVAIGDVGTAMGRNTTASGYASTAMGYSTEASGDYSTAMGAVTTASGSYSTAMGYSTEASGQSSTAMGGYTTASGYTSTAMGRQTSASGVYSTAMGRNTTASGVSSTAMGESTTASDFGSTVIGQYNSSGSTVTNSADSFSTANTAFVIGNGVDGSNTSDAFKVLFNGDATVGNDLTVSGDVVINSDMRLKANILSLGSTLYKLLQIDGKTYTMKRDATKKQKIGLLAQDIEKVFPELVVENKGIKSVNYQGLVPVLINALKEQQSEIDALKKQEKRLERLELIISNMDK